jgi:hypothetical protein
VPPFTGRGPSVPVGPIPPTISRDSAQRHLHHNLAYERQVRNQSPLPPDDWQKSGHMLRNMEVKLEDIALQEVVCNYLSYMYFT